MKFLKFIAYSFTFFFAVMCFSIYANAQTDSSSAVFGIITGTVLNTGTQSPLNGASIIVNGTKIGTLTNSNGKFTLRKVPVGIVSVKVSAIGFESRTYSDIAVSSGKPSTITVELNEKAIQIQSTEVEASYFQRSPEQLPVLNY
jgi:hypothetical protein